MNHLSAGLSHIDLPRGGFLYLGDEIPHVPEWRRPKTFDPTKHHFNLLDNLDYRKSCEIVNIFDAVFSRGESTLTKDTGLEFIAEQLERNPETLRDLIPEPDKKSSTGHVWAYNKVRRILRSPVLSSALCTSTNTFKFRPNSVTLARINRAELGDDDSLFLGLAVIAQSKGQVVIEDFGFYGREHHIALIREERLIANIRTLGRVKRVAPNLYDELLAIPSKIAAHANYEDAETLAKAAGLVPHTIEHSDFISEAMR